METLPINAREVPRCQCGATDWCVIQEIRKDSLLLRVDGLGDLVVKEPDPLKYYQSLAMLCVACGALYSPVSACASEAIEAYHENGGEDGFSWPTKVRQDD